MNAYEIIGTIIGGFIFPFIIQICWGKLIETFGPIGGWMAGGFIVGTSFILLHAIGLIHQSGKVWIDMALAAGIGCFVSSVYLGAPIRKSIPVIFDAIIGGLIAGGILYVMFQYAAPWPI